MGKFNVSKSSTGIKTYEGAKGVAKDAVTDFMNNLFSNNFEDAFYNSSSERIARFVKLVNRVREERGDEFVAKMAMFSRNEIGMRSVAQATAALLNDSKMECKRRFYKEFCHRPDDIAEILAFLGVSKPSHAMLRGFRDYLSSVGEYQLSKYKMSGHRWNIYDIVNITHAHSDAIDKLKAGTLTPPDTWEVSISGAKDDDERKANWVRLVEEHKLGYTALIMNLRNILNSAPSNVWVRDVLCPQVRNKDAIIGSMTFPYKIYNAYKNVYGNVSLDAALADAFVISCSTVRKMEGDTLIIMDVSGSMQFEYSRMGSLKIAEICACYAAAFIMSDPEHMSVCKFATQAEMFSYSNRGIDPFKLIKLLMENDNLGYATYIDSAYDIIDGHYDRIIIFSDMQVMESAYGINRHDMYCDKYGECPVYSFDLGNYHAYNASSKTDRVRFFTALSPHVFDFIAIVDGGGDIAEYIDDNYAI